MAVYDRWHKDGAPCDKPCSCGSPKNPLYPSADHKKGDRWQVRWRDLNGKQKKKNFAKKLGTDPETCADAFNDKVGADLDSGSYVDPRVQAETFGPYAEQWLKSRTHDEATARTIRARLYWHVLEDPDNPGRTRRGGPALGHLAWGRLQRYPSLTQAWIAGLTCSESTAAKVADAASMVVGAAMDDGLIGRNPVLAKSVTRPSPPPRRAEAWTVPMVAAVRAALAPRYRIAMRIGPSTGVRQSEMLALAETDVSWLAKPGERTITVAVQLKHAGGRLCFAPVKNRKAHDVPVPDELTDAIAAHLREHPAAAVTLPWHDPRDRERHGQMVTRKLIVHRDDGRPFTPTMWNDIWKPALHRAGLIGARRRGSSRAWPAARDKGTHAAWRHTAVSHWLARGVEMPAVAEWIGDSLKTVYETYAHMVPGAGSRGRAATSAFLAEVDAASCAPDVPSAAQRGSA